MLPEGEFSAVRGAKRHFLCLFAITAALLCPQEALADGEPFQPGQQLLLQREEGRVRIRNVTGTVRMQRTYKPRRNESYPVLELTLEMENRLEAAVWPLEFKVFTGDAQGRLSKMRHISSGTTLQPQGTTAVTLEIRLDEKEQANAFDVGLSDFFFETTPSAKTLLKLAASEAPVDPGVAMKLSALADSLPAPKREQLAQDFAEAVKEGASGEHARTLAPLYALYALGLVGGEDAVPVLLEALTREASYQEASTRVEAFRVLFPESAVPQGFPRSHVREVVTGALGTMPAEAAVPRLVMTAYTGEERLRKHAREMLESAWPLTGPRVAALREASAAPVLETLCKGGDALAVRLLMALAAVEADGGKARECIAAMPGAVVVTGLLATLQEPLRTSEPLAVELLQAQGRGALAALRSATRGLKVAPGAEVAALAHALAQSAQERHQEQFQQAMAALTNVLNASPGGPIAAPSQQREALAALRQAEAHAGAEQTRPLVQAYVLVSGRAAQASELRLTRGVIARISELLRSRPPEASVDAELERLASQLATQFGGREAALLLKQLKPLFSNPQRLEAWVKEVQALDPSNGAVHSLLAEKLPGTPEPGIVWANFLVALVLVSLVTLRVLKWMSKGR